MSWIDFAILAGLCSALFNFLNRYLLKAESADETAYAWYYETLRTVCFFAVALFDWKIFITTKSIMLFSFLGLTEFVAGYWYMKMHGNAHLSVSSIISRTRPIWAAIFAFILLREYLHMAEYVGIAILFLGSTIAVAPRKLVFDKGMRYANLSAISIALESVLTKMALPFGSNSIVNIAMSGPSVILFPIFMKSPFKRIKTLVFHKDFFLKSLAIVINVISVYFFTQAARLGEISKVMAIYQGMIIFPVLMGIIFLHEREDIQRKIFGTLITIIGVILLSWV